MSDIDDLRSELAERDRQLAEAIAALRREQQPPLTQSIASENQRRGYAAKAAEREAAEGGEAA